MKAVYLLIHRANETKAFSRNCPDQPLVLASVADRIPGGVDTAVERRVRHDSAAPYQGNEIVPADDMIAVFQQMNQQVEYLWLHRYQRTITAQEAAGPANKDLVSIGNLAMQGGSAPAASGGARPSGVPGSYGGAIVHGPSVRSPSSPRGTGSRC